MFIADYVLSSPIAVYIKCYCYCTASGIMGTYRTYIYLYNLTYCQVQDDHSSGRRKIFVFSAYTAGWSPRSVSARTMRGARLKLRYTIEWYTVYRLPEVAGCLLSTTIYYILYVIIYNIKLYFNVHYHHIIMIDRVE